jgi:hypothetical protein
MREQNEVNIIQTSSVHIFFSGVNDHGDAMPQFFLYLLVLAPLRLIALHVALNLG